MAYRSALILGGLAALLLSGPASAVSPSQLSGYGTVFTDIAGGGWKAAPGSVVKINPVQAPWTTVGPSGAATHFVRTEAAQLAGRGGPMVVQAAQRITAGEAAAVVARCAANPLCIGATATVGVATKVLYDQYRMKRGQEGGVLFDEGAPEQEKTGWKCGWSTGISPFNACLPVWNEAVGAKVVITPMTCGTPNNGVANCSGTFREPGYGPYGWAQQAVATTVLECPTVIDFEEPANLIPSGTKVGPDAKCPTGRYSPITIQEAANKVSANPPASSQNFQDAVREAIQNGNESAPSELSTTGPASQLGTPTSTTTTNSQGTTTTTQQPKYSYQYAGDTITYQTTNNTYTCAGAGSCSVENADESTEETVAPPAPQDPKDPCTANPDRAGCARLGDPPSPEEVKKKDIAITVNPVGGFGADSGSCPAPITLRSGATVDPYGLFCTYMGGIRFAIVGVAWLIAALIFIGRIE